MLVVLLNLCMSETNSDVKILEFTHRVYQQTSKTMLLVSSNLDWTKTWIIKATIYESKVLNTGPVTELTTGGVGSPVWAELLSPLPPCWSSSWSSAPACAGVRRSPWGPSRWRLC